ncbi:WhiB family transcriptional regulator [Parenemella sanctibonifatiensis]|nr:WhiB family transcriptional regulator [Parenemella sanctibonifatiensis]
MSATPCSQQADLFQHPLMEEPPTSSARPDARREHTMLQRRATNVCASCPLLVECLYEAVVKHDVSGFVAGTTQRQRNQIRARLGWKVAPEDFDTLAGVTTPNRQIDHAEVVRLRNANPTESLETLAHRLGCSLSTVKRHLRKARAEANKPTLTKVAPTREDVMKAYAEICAPTQPARQTLAA